MTWTTVKETTGRKVSWGQKQVTHWIKFTSRRRRRRRRRRSDDWYRQK